ncbi:hypothetical protein F503_02681 [Ophiostoma piceae UAMH 11346]|uniref:LysM domain-containing protein n=1 Tax=Ophiostoma piceae (strain UAMH 11346) TaxID=1262450 RepID=S3CJE2_OPHP1|nr:hypothetical protein F503_02681 [Ophiostoma piceae UAMH 11346]
MHFVSLLALGLVAAVPAACATLGARADVVSCLMSSSPNFNDTCTSFAGDFSITVAQLVSLNPGLNCTNPLDEDGDFCVLGTITGTSTTSVVTNDRTTTYVAPTSVNTVSSFEVTFVTTNTSTPTTTVYTPYPVDTDIAKNCDKFYKIVKGDTCDKIASANGISTDEIYAWNNDVGTNCYGLYVGYYLCVHTPGAITSAVSTTTSGTTATASGPATATASATTTTGTASAAPSPTQPGTISSCTKFHKVVSGDTCATIESDAGISAAEFSAWNTGIDSDCSNIYLDYYVCIDGPAIAAVTTTSSATATTGSAVPSPTQPGTVDACTGFHKVVSGDTCATIESAAGISAAEFAAWNTGINSDCSNIYLDYYVCIAGPAVGSPATTTTATPTTTSGSTMPSPTQPGTISTCAKFHEVVSGDYCYLIETEAGISSDDFFKWNTGINTDCSNIYLGYYVCIGA